MGLGPFGEEGVGAEDVFVEVVERERFFKNEQAIAVAEFLGFPDFLLLGEHEGDFGEFDGEGLDVDAEELVDGDGAFERLAFRDFREADEDFAFETLEFAVGDVEEVS
jgi:hypothetical protein